MYEKNTSGGQQRRDSKQELSERLRAYNPELADKVSINTFTLNPDGSMDQATQDAMKAIQRQDGCSLYEEIITNLDTEYARAQYSAGPKRHGISDAYLLAHVSDAAELHRLNMISIQRNEFAIDDHTFEETIVAQAPSEIINKIGAWIIPQRTIFVDE